MSITDSIGEHVLAPEHAMHAYLIHRGCLIVYTKSKYDFAHDYAMGAYLLHYSGWVLHSISEHDLVPDCIKHILGFAGHLWY